MRILGMAALCAALGGCASVTRGTTENLGITSTPPGAEAIISGLENPTTCLTPCSVVVKRNADISVTVQKPGYEPQTIPLTREIQGTGAAGFAGNVLAGGVVGMGVDAVTGAARDHKPNPVIVTLQPNAPAARPAPPPRKPRPPAAPETGT
jgi:PEGA domain